MRCNCDACVEVKEAGTAWSEDGYCAFCAKRCYLPMASRIAGQTGANLSRASLPRADRLAMHEAERRPRPHPYGPGAYEARPFAGVPQSPPLPAAFPERGILDIAISGIQNKKTRRQAQVVLSLAEAIAPAAAPRARQAIAAVKRLLR